MSFAVFSTNQNKMTGFFLISVIVLGVIGFFSVSLTEKMEKNTKNLSDGYEIIEDNG